MQLFSIVIVTPALADANNGNWQTARRWASMLQPHFRVTLTRAWDGQPADAMIALHARRSAESIALWHERQPQRPQAPLVVALTGTDLYRDLPDGDLPTQASLQAADRLLVLQSLAVQSLPPQYRAKAVVCLQSCPARQPVSKTTRHLRAVMVGHLRAEKAPDTYFQAARLLQGQGRADILLDHVGSALTPDWTTQARATQQACPHYRWLGALSHAASRRRIQAAHVLVHPSRMEGGAHTVMEAITSGTPVIASRVDGNVGLLGADYAGYFPVGDAAALATLLQQCRDDPAMLDALRRQVAERAPLFTPQRDQATLLALMTDLLKATP
jgi:putative glycosyltransferase (TIGR04348 family)